MTELICTSIKNECLASDDSTLVLAAQQDPLAFEQLYRKWLNPVYRYFFYRVGDVKDAEDLTSQVFLKIYQDLPNFRSSGSFAAWLFSIAHARAVDHYRKAKPIISLESNENKADVIDLAACSARVDDISRIVRLIHSLPYGEQELIRLRFMAGLNYREMGIVLKRSEDAVRKSLNRLLKRLQIEMEVDHE